MTVVETPQALAILAVVLLVARFLGYALSRLGQSAVLGEMLAGLLLGLPVVDWVDPGDTTLRLFAEMGAVFLFLRLGLETDVRQLFPVLGTALVVAVAAVALPLTLGYAVCRWHGIEYISAVYIGVTLSAMGIGVTARVLEDAGRIQDVEGRIALAAAVLGNTICLVILAVVSHVAHGEQVTLLGIAKPAGVAVAFFVAAILVGRLTAPWLVRGAQCLQAPGAFTVVAVVVAFGLAWLAACCGLMPITGAFLAGLLLRQAQPGNGVEPGIAALSHFFVPLFFAWIGAALDVAVFNPFGAGHRSTLLLAGWLTLAAVAGKLLAPYLACGFRGRSTARLVGAALLPGAGVAAAFAQAGLAAGILDQVTFNAATIVAVLTAFAAPILVRSFSRIAT